MQGCLNIFHGFDELGVELSGGFAMAGGANGVGCFVAVVLLTGICTLLVSSSSSLSSTHAGVGLRQKNEDTSKKGLKATVMLLRSLVAAGAGSQEVEMGIELIILFRTVLVWLSTLNWSMT
jgi:hypothetical protein